MPDEPAWSTSSGLNDILSQTTTNAEPHIGWLKELGVDYGWGPTTLMLNTLEYIHVYSGLPWWASIMATVVGVRVLLLRWHVQSSDIMARMALVGDEMKPLQEKMRAAHAAGDSLAQAAHTQELRALYSAAGIKPLKMLAPIVIQGVLGYGMFRLINGLSQLPVPGMEEGGMLWFTDLTVTDPFRILPIASGALLYWVMRVCSKDLFPLHALQKTNRNCSVAEKQERQP